MMGAPSAQSAIRLILGAGLSVSVTLGCWGQAAGSLTERDIEVSETRTALNAVIRDNEKLEQKLAEAQATIAQLQNNLTIATAEGEVLKRQAAQMKLRLEALSLNGGNQDSAIEGRLLKAVASLREAQTHRDELLKANQQLIAAITAYRDAADKHDPEVALLVESAVRNAQKAGDNRTTEAAGEATAGKLTAGNSGVVISMKEDLALIVANVGREGGVKVGMPFNVFRGEEQIATVRVVDVRDKFCGAVIQGLSSDSKKIKVGDRLIIGASQKL
jgi:hypothetical protein